MRVNENSQSIKLSRSADLPTAVKRSLGIGRFKAKVFQRPGGELIAKAIQDIGEVMIKLIYISDSDKAKSVELTERELHRVLLIAKDLRKMTGRPSEEECNQAWLEEE